MGLPEKTETELRKLPNRHPILLFPPGPSSGTEMIDELKVAKKSFLPQVISGLDVGVAVTTVSAQCFVSRSATGTYRSRRSDQTRELIVEWSPL
jgi:hypothetical protein